jgi:hypothetical protein
VSTISPIGQIQPEPLGPIRTVPSPCVGDVLPVTLLIDATGLKILALGFSPFNRQESNLHISRYHAGALPLKLLLPFYRLGRSDPLGPATLTGLEPATPTVTGWCANQLRYRAKVLRTPYGIRTRDLYLERVVS